MNELIQITDSQIGEGAVQAFNFDAHSVRTININGEPWFVAADVLTALELDRKALERLDDDEKGVSSIHTLGGAQEMTIASEAGLYTLILGSRKPEAKRFKRWVTHEVLPAIRETGGYGKPAAPLPDLNDPAFLRSTLLTYTEKVIALEAKVQEQAPEARFHDAVAGAINCQSVQEIAKVLGTGSKRMFEFLRGEKLLMPNNLPYQQHLDAGYFRVVEKQYNDGHGESHTYCRTLVTGKGLAYIQKRLNNGGALPVLH